MRWLRNLCHNLARKAAIERELNDELSSYLDLLTRRNIQNGMSEEEARRAAALQVGGAEQVKEQVRESRAGFHLEVLLIDARYGLRALLKKPGFTFTAVVALGLGIGANTAILSVINGVLLRSLPFANPTRLVMVWEQNLRVGSKQNVISPANFLDWQKQTPSFQHFAAFWDSRATLTGGGEPEELPVQRVSLEFFETLGVNPAVGRAFVSEEDRENNNFAAILSYDLWKRRFGGEAGVIGTTTTINGRPCAIVGVMPPGFHFFNDRAQAWLPLGLSLTEDYRKSGRFLRTIARLKDGATIQQAQAELDRIAKQLEQAYPDYNATWGARIVPLHEQIVGEIRPLLFILLGAVGFVLLIACANVANLMLSRAVERQKELALRAAFGAGRGRLIRQLLTESVVLAFLGGTLGVLLAYWGVELLLAFGPNNIPRLHEINVDTRVLAFTLLVSLGAGILLGLAPALQSSRPDLNNALRDAARSSSDRSSRGLRNSLVVAEVSLALVLLVGAGLLIRSFMQLERVKTGFEADRVLTMRVQLPAAKYPQFEQRQRFFDRAEERIASLPGVQAVGAITYLPLTRDASSTIYSIVGRQPLPSGQWPGTEERTVTPGYFRTVGIPLLQGRLIEARDRDSHVCVINETFARQAFPNENPLGKHVMLKWSEDIVDEIVGVVGDVKDAAMDADPRPVVYWNYPRDARASMNLIVRTSADPLALTAAVQREIHAVDPDQPIADLRTMRQVISNSIARPRFNMMLLGIFAVVALVLASVGLYGVMNYSATQRTREIGIRMALGASRGDILRLVVGNGMLLTVIGLGLGLIGAVGLTRLLRSFLFSITSTDLATYLGVSLLLGMVALLATYIPARKAMRVNPTVALRYE